MERAQAVARTSQGGRAVPSVWRATLAGLCASLVGIGLARFAYTPLIPALITEGWFAPSAAAYLGAANLAGYLAGAILARPLAAHSSAVTMLRGTMLLVSAAFFACAFPLSFLWFFVWRFASGFSGGVLMVLAAPTVLATVPVSRRGIAGGIIFTGVGLGVAASGTMVPILINVDGLPVTWFGLAGLSLALTLLAWGGWPRETAPVVAPAARAAVSSASPVAVAERRGGSTALKALYAEYGLHAIGLVPHMVFFVDFTARGLGQGLTTGSQYWVFFGFGAMTGPMLVGYLADRIGFGRALRLCFVVEAMAVALPAISTNPVWLTVSVVVVGGFTPGFVPLVLGRIGELVAHDAAAQKAAWSTATTAFAVVQATAAYSLSYVFALTNDYARLFQIGAVAAVVALLTDLTATAGAVVAARRQPVVGARG